MWLESFRIKHYRSIVDSGLCYLSGDNITIMAGKNESGKTAILEALEDFSYESDIREAAVPLYRPEEEKPQITVRCSLSKQELQEVFADIGVDRKVKKGTVVEIVKTYPNSYSLTDDGGIGLLDPDQQADVASRAARLDADYRALLEHLDEDTSSWPALDVRNIPEARSRIENLTAQHAGKFEGEEQNEIDAEASSLLEQLTGIEHTSDSGSGFLQCILDGYLPNFILFSSFDDTFPSEIEISEAQDNELMQDLALISDLDIELIQSGVAAAKVAHKQRLNVKLQQEYKRFWVQDLTNLYIDWDSSKLCFFITENDNFYPPNMRSKGKQWHLSFYVRISARSKEDVPNIILIDEPGLYLHAKAQQDVLSRLEASAEDLQVVFSTHSPFLINVSRLNRIRLVSRNVVDGTVISNKIHKGADAETLTPIISAIGLDLSLGLDIAKNNNIIFEGITDYYYVLAMAKVLDYQFTAPVHWIPGTGATKTTILTSLMLGWGLDYCIVLDNDTQGKRTRQKLEREFTNVKINIVPVSETKDDEVEDLFTKGDFAKYVLPEKLSIGKAKNSQLFKQKDKSFDKVLLAKLFFERVLREDISLTSTTKDHFTSLPDRINSTLSG